MKIYKVWDTIERAHFKDDFIEEAAAHGMIDDLLDAGQYPDKPCTVYTVDEYNAGHFVKRIDFSPSKAQEYHESLFES